MDPFSQALLGAVVAQAAAGRRLGRRAALWGAAAGAAPDLDMLFGFDFFSQLRWHRGITHALWFGPVAGALWAWLHVRRQRRKGRSAPFAPWFATFGLALLSHPLLDVCTSYGTQLLAPFSNARFAWHAVPVIEPRYTLILLVGLAAGWWLRRWAPVISGLTVMLSSLYLGWGWWLNQRAIEAGETQLAARGVAAEVHAFPAFFQMAQRRVVGFAEQEVWVGFVDAANPGCIAWDRAPRRPHPLVDALRATREGAIFSWFTDGVETWLVTPEAGGWRVELSDLRYGLAADASRGQWGVRARFDGDGRVLEPVSHFMLPLEGLLPRWFDWVDGAALPAGC
ncbi:MAG: metal-dependent hydrolase [Pseudomonadota bacterium]